MSDTNLQKARARKERMLGSEAIIRSLEAEDVTIFTRDLALLLRAAHVGQRDLKHDLLWPF